MSYKQHEIDPQFGFLFLAGEYVDAGTYRNVRTGREVCLSEDGFLPASFDGSVAVYSRAPRTWAGLVGQHSVGAPAPAQGAGQQQDAARR